MPAPEVFEYAVIRVVPREERAEFLNAGAVLFSRVPRFLAAAVDLDEARLLALAPGIDLATVRAALAAIPRIAAGDSSAGPIARLEMPERFRWLTSPRSTVVQPSPVHTGRCADPARELEHLMDRLVRPPGPGRPTPTSSRQP